MRPKYHAGDLVVGPAGPYGQTIPREAQLIKHRVFYCDQYYYRTDKNLLRESDILYKISVPTFKPQRTFITIQMHCVFEGEISDVQVNDLTEALVKKAITMKDEVGESHFQIQTTRF